VAPKAELVRIAATPPRGGREALAVIDPAGSMPGRGAYLCRGSTRLEPAQACLRQALRRGGIQRGLRRKVSVDSELVESVGP